MNSDFVTFRDTAGVVMGVNKQHVLMAHIAQGNVLVLTTAGQAPQMVDVKDVGRAQRASVVVSASIKIGVHPNYFRHVADELGLIMPDSASPGPMKVEDLVNGED